MRHWSVEQTQGMIYLGQAIRTSLTIWWQKRRALRNPTWKIRESYDYATNYGDFNQDTLIGTPCSFGDIFFCEKRRNSIIALQHALKERGVDFEYRYGGEERHG